MQQHLFLIGYGYTAKHIAALALKHGFKVSATSRQITTPKKTEEGVTLHPFNGAVPKGVTAVLSTVPPSKHLGTQTPSIKDPVLAMYSGSWPKNIWLGYLSSTGVYGDTQGQSVTEESPLLATSTRGLARIQAEKAWLNLSIPVHIFRLAGIYGPGRNMLERLKKGNVTTLEHSNRPVNRIHVLDIAHAVLKSIATPQTKTTVYNLADDMPTPTAKVIAYSAELLNIPLPAPTNKTSHLHDGSRVVCNTFIKENLDFSLRYPTYKEGLKGC